MKKIFALLMAVAMMATVAMAADPGLSTLVDGQVDPDKTIAILPGDMRLHTGTATAPVVGVDLATRLGATGTWKMNKDNFTITKKVIKKGAALVTAAEFDGEDGRIIIKTKANAGLAAPKNVPNLIIGEISIKARDDMGSGSTKITKNDIFTFSADGSTFSEVAIKLGYAETAVKGTVSDGDEFDATGVMFKYEMDDANYATLNTLQSIGDIDVGIEGRVYKNDKFSLEVKTDANATILKDAAYELASLSFFQVKTSGLPTTSKISITAPEDAFIYEIKDNKIVTAADMKWNADNAAWEGKIRTTREFVISDIKLAAGTVGTPDNPATGANDVVGIAAALAVISLVAAGAVSLKK